MKILIKEDKRDRLAKQILTEEFSNMYEDVNYITDSTGTKKNIDYRNGDGVVMIYGESTLFLYICEDITNPIKMFSYTPQQLKNVVGEWFSQMFELPVERVHHVNKSILQ